MPISAGATRTAIFRRVAEHLRGRLRSFGGRDQQRAISDLKFLFRNLPSVLSPWTGTPGVSTTRDRLQLPTVLRGGRIVRDVRMLVAALLVPLLAATAIAAVAFAVSLRSRPAAERGRNAETRVPGLSWVGVQESNLRKPVTPGASR